ncbi:NAD(+) diphosphatase [Dokdonella soli]|uniref:NAD(+) diphosphatase n=1 Tax=Dokdonella soli TaxID=529810 RepID=UPI0031D57963
MSDRTNIFAGIALDRNAELRDDAEWAAAQLADPTARFLLLGAEAAGGRQALLQAASEALRWLDQDERRRFAPDLAPTYLGSDGIGPLFSLCAEASLADRVRAELGGVFIDLRSAGMRLHPFQAGLFAYARAIAHWQARTRWCGACGATLQLVALGHRGKCTNPSCALEHFPRVDPAMIVIVSWRDQCLLGSQSTWSENRWSTLAGFIEPGESLEDAVRREVFEEAGVKVGACAYHSSQPWPFPSSLMLGFTAEAEDPAIRLGRELSDARWFSVDEIVDGLAEHRLVLPPRLSVSHELIAHWLRERAGLELAELLSDEPWQKPRA